MTSIETLNVLLSICFGISVMFIWLGFYPENLNFLMKRISDEQDYELTQIELTNTLFSNFILPTAQKAVPYTAKYIKREQLIEAEKKIKLAGSPFNLKPIEFVNIKIPSMLIGVVFGLLFSSAGDLPLVICLAMGVALGLFAPELWLKQAAKKRVERIEAEIPNLLDLISVSMASGMTLLSALDVVCANNKGVFVTELEKIKNDVQSGASIKQAFYELTQRCNSKKVNELYQNVRLSEDLGTPIAENLKRMAETTREETFEIIKQKAAKAAVLVLLPVALFIFPSLGLILIGPILPNFLGQ